MRHDDSATETQERGRGHGGGTHKDRVAATKGERIEAKLAASDGAKVIGELHELHEAQ